MEDQLKWAFLAMKRQDVLDIVKNGLELGVDPFAILKTCQEAMEEVGRRFEKGEFFLSELIYSAEVFKGVSAILEPKLSLSWALKEQRGVVVFGTPRGDIHDLGKNLVITLMRAEGFVVHDLGVDVPPDRFAEKLKETDAQILAMSALITPAFASMKETINLLEEKGLRNKTFVIIGGGVTTEIVRREVGADAQTLDPIEAIRLCSKFIECR
jgi:5-methyltetrahydrofolate--homocysteine methyltransferase